METHIISKNTKTSDPSDAGTSTLRNDSRAHQSLRFLRLASGFWRGPSGLRAWILSSTTLLFLAGNILAALALNRWNKFFFDSLEMKNHQALIFGLGLVLVLVFFSSAASAGLAYFRMRLQIRWRQWLTSTLVSRWLSNRHFYQLTIVDTEASNPEARILEDSRVAIELLLDCTLGVINALLAGISFIGILWYVGGSIEITGYTIPGYMVVVCLAYSAITTYGMFLLGRPLVRRVEEKAAGEAQMRYELTRVKDNAENIALTGGDEDERLRLEETLGDLVRRLIGVMIWQCRMVWLNGANLVLAPVVPLLLGAPKYLSGEMSLGSLMQAATAFMQVQVAVNWLADNAMRLADWFGASNRVTELSDAIDRLAESLKPTDPHDIITLGTSPDKKVYLRHLNINLYDGKVMIDDAEAVISPGEKVLVKGDSGCGKSTLIRAMAGLWPWGSGEILRPEGAQIAFMPQRPYFPLGSLRSALLYPNANPVVDEAKIFDILARCGLEHLISRIDDTDNWSGLLSGGEQQRLAFARVLIHPPDILIMDEPTSSLDELSQFRMMEYMRDLLPKAMVIHAGHRPGLEKFHDREIQLVRAKRGGPVTTQELRFSKAEILARKILGSFNRETT
jgi:vitamin B12/bleomycin/antimicrobial peptide transport system ATP-binding/permease protein